MDEALRLEELMKRLRQMSAGDRKAIIARLSLEQRFALDALLAAKPGAQATPQAAAPSNINNQIFSTTLAKMLDRIDENGEPLGGNGASLTPATRIALQGAAATICEDGRKNKPENARSLRALVHHFLFAQRA